MHFSFGTSQYSPFARRLADCKDHSLSKSLLSVVSTDMRTKAIVMERLEADLEVILSNTRRMEGMPLLHAMR